MVGVFQKQVDHLLQWTLPFIVLAIANEHTIQSNPQYQAPDYKGGLG